MIRKASLSLVLSICTLFALKGQAIENFKYRLSQGGLGGATATVIEYGDAAAAVRTLSSGRKPSTISGYRVRIFFDNSQNARQYAQGTKARFEEMYPETAAYLNYENPYFKVTVGNCLTMEEAVILWGRIKGSFDKAFVVREDIPLSAFTK